MHHIDGKVSFPKMCPLPPPWLYSKFASQPSIQTLIGPAIKFTHALILKFAIELEYDELLISTKIRNVNRTAYKRLTHSLIGQDMDGARLLPAQMERDYSVHKRCHPLLSPSIDVLPQVDGHMLLSQFIALCAMLLENNIHQLEVIATMQWFFIKLGLIHINTVHNLITTLNQCSLF